MSPATNRTSATRPLASLTCTGSCWVVRSVVSCRFVRRVVELADEVGEAVEDVGGVRGVTERPPEQGPGSQCGEGCDPLGEVEGRDAGLLLLVLGHEGDAGRASEELVLPEVEVVGPAEDGVEEHEGVEASGAGVWGVKAGVLRGRWWDACGQHGGDVASLARRRSPQTDVYGVRDVKDQISREVLNALDVIGIGIASATYDIVGLAPLRVAPGAEEA